jgi:hypothetical protein
VRVIKQKQKKKKISHKLGNKEENFPKSDEEEDFPKNTSFRVINKEERKRPALGGSPRPRGRPTPGALPAFGVQG